MAVRSMETTETAMETDGDGSGGTYPSRQGAGTETSIPQNLLTVAAELRNYFWKIAESLRVFRPEASYRRRGVARGQPGAPHTWVARPGPGPRQPYVRVASGPSPSSLRISGCSREK
jgi:hypothetical protein